MSMSVWHAVCAVRQMNCGMCLVTPVSGLCVKHLVVSLLDACRRGLQHVHTPSTGSVVTYVQECHVACMTATFVEATLWSMVKIEPFKKLTEVRLDLGGKHRASTYVGKICVCHEHIYVNVCFLRPSYCLLCRPTPTCITCAFINIRTQGATLRAQMRARWQAHARRTCSQEPAILHANAVARGRAI